MLKRKTKRVLRHIMSNNGEGYLWFIFMLVSLMLVFGAILNTLDTTIKARNIRSEVHAASEEILGDIREHRYGNLNTGATDISSLFGTGIDSDSIGELLAEKLGTEISSSFGGYILTKRDEKGRVSYKISNITIDYFSRINGNQYFYYSDDIQYLVPDMSGEYYEASAIMGDINKDGAVTEADVNLARQFIDGKEPQGVTLIDVDIDRNGIANNKDIALLKALISLYAYQDGHTDASTALLLVTLDLEMPVQVGTFTFLEHKNTYSYPMMLSFLPSEK